MKQRIALFAASILFATAAHAWQVKGPDGTTQMKITDDGKVGVGTTAPASKLHVAGAVQVGNDTATCTAAKAGAIRWTGSAFEGCNGSSWNALAGGGGSSVVKLVNGVHDSTQCGVIGSVVTGSSGESFCRIATNSCPSGWTQYQNWTATAATSCSGSSNRGTSCTTGSHVFANASRETCAYLYCPPGALTGDNSCVMALIQATCSATAAAVGCY